MQFVHEHFTMGFHQALDFDIDYRDFEKVSRLPGNIPVMAIAGVWGDYSNIRCLFIDANGRCYMRNIRKWGDKGYFIKELELDAKDLEVGQVFQIVD